MAFDPVNDLERSLVKAATDPAHRPQFYQDFVGADIFAVQQGPAHSGAERKALSSGETVQLRSWERDGQTIIPIFSSLPRLKAFIKEDASYLGVNAMEFLKMTRSASLVLNPGSDYGKDFTADEIGSILDGSIWKPAVRYVAQKETKVFIGQPANYPSELAAALSRYFQTTQHVKRAYLVHFFNPERDEKPHTLIAIDATGDWDKIVAGAGIVARDVTIPDPPVDFMQMKRKGGIQDLLPKSVVPFYEKKGLLRVLKDVVFSPGK